MQDSGQDVGVVGNRVVVLVAGGRPAGVVLRAVLVPGRAVKQRDNRRLGGDDLLQLVESGLLGGRVVAAGELGERRRRRACLSARTGCCRSSSGSSSTGSVPGCSSGSWRRSCRPGSRRTTWWPPRR